MLDWFNHWKLNESSSSLVVTTTSLVIHKVLPSSSKREVNFLVREQFFLISNVKECKKKWLNPIRKKKVIVEVHEE